MSNKGLRPKPLFNPLANTRLIKNNPYSLFDECLLHQRCAVVPTKGRQSIKTEPIGEPRNIATRRVMP
ncbi:MAG: hypothetical protein J5I52_08250 [Saprospiraceae bacterium]|nr:hypothetical protein [Saprospiraceae bacterium]MCZ2336832.1 hypothetical protein [Chitinophagales bacterium]